VSGNNSISRIKGTNTVTPFSLKEKPVSMKKVELMSDKGMLQ
jgi:hypothetical protein